jgi:hypothetical protein
MIQITLNWQRGLNGIRSAQHEYNEVRELYLSG